MHAREIARRFALLPYLWRQAPRYAKRHAAYAVRSRRDPMWLDTPTMVPLSATAGGGLSLEVVPGDEIGRFLYLYGMWDLLGTRLVRLYLRPGMTVLDVGANLGYYSLVAARQVGPAGLVHSFEPHDEIRDRLARNAARNGLTNIVVRSEAVTNRTGEVRFYRSVDPSNEGISSIVEGPAPHGELREERPLLVPSTRLDDVADGIERRVDLIKLDVEGAEQAAFEGGSRLLSDSDAPLVLFESYELELTAQLLRAYGFTIRRLSHDWRSGLRLIDEPAGAFQGEPNYVAYKRHHEPALSGLT